MYDYDVVVVGAGPAGLAAATRVRWVKGYHALAGSVCLVESGAPGGLLRWGSCVMTGPGWAYAGQELTDKLMADVERLKIPVVSGLVQHIERDGPLLVTTLNDGRTLRSLAVVLATGFRPLANESDFYLRGVRITFKGYDHFPSLLRSCAKDAAGRGLVIVGNAKTAHLDEIVDGVRDAAGGVRIIDRGRLVEVLGDDRVDGVRIRDEDSELMLPCGAVLMDYNAFELTPTFDISGLDVQRDERGFVVADSWMRTSSDGVFVAGDLTGRYASTLMALGDGVCAGMSAYAYTFEKKLGRPPYLFAYAATDERLSATPQDVPTLPDDAVPVAVGAAPDWVDGQKTVADYAAEMDATADEIRAWLQPYVDDKSVTVHLLKHA